MKLVSQFGHVWVIAISMFTAVVATLAVNIAANVVSPANDFANAFPKWISFRLGGLITGIIGLLMQPWRLLADPSGYIFKWLVGYSGGLGSIAGVLIADYWLVRKQRLALRGPVSRMVFIATPPAGTGARSSRRWSAAGSRGSGSSFHIRPLYDYAWFVGFGSAAVLHAGLMMMVPPEHGAVAQPAAAAGS
jgi:NCS1 family nucleobase:cation symporter-1